MFNGPSMAGVATAIVAWRHEEKRAPFTPRSRLTGGITTLPYFATLFDALKPEQPCTLGGRSEWPPPPKARGAVPTTFAW
jgi:hypothetical protein